MEQVPLTNQRETLASLAGDILRETHKLVGQEVALAKDELAPNWVILKRVACYLSLSAVVAPASMVVLALMLTHLLAAITKLEAWICDAIVAMGLAGVALLLLAITRFYSKKLDFYPRNMLENIRENIQCLNKENPEVHK